MVSVGVCNLEGLHHNDTCQKFNDTSALMQTAQTCSTFYVVAYSLAI